MIHTYLAEFLTIAVLHLLAVMSPGPDFILISKNSLVYSRRTGVFSAIGLAFGIMLHITYCLIGIGLIISKSIIIFSLIKYAGAAYLIYIGILSLRAKPQNQKIDEIIIQKSITAWQAIKTGFLTNALNPKATLFFLAVFTQVIHQSTPIGIKILYGAEMSFMTFLWFSIVAIVLSHKKIKQPFLRVQHLVERTMGGILILLGLKVALSSSK